MPPKRRFISCEICGDRVRSGEKGSLWRNFLWIRPVKMWDSDYVVDQLIKEYDETLMPVPDIDSEPDLLISKVRKHYMDYMIKLLSVNYENNQRLLNKNIYLPSAIWRCAKSIEMKAAQTCMVVQLYRKHIVTVIKDMKNDTKKGKLYKKLYECLHRPPENEKKLQTTLNKSEDCNCQCNCHLRKKRRKVTDSLRAPHGGQHLILNDDQGWNTQNKIPVLVNSHVMYPQLIGSNIETKESFFTEQLPTIQCMSNNTNPSNSSTQKTTIGISVESQDSDDLMIQLEKLFQADPNDDDLFEGALCDTMEAAACDDNIKQIQLESSDISNATIVQKQDIVIENHAAQIKSLDERLASLTGLLVNSTDNNISQQKTEPPKNKRGHSSKWLCEEYFLKSRLFELLDEIGDCNRTKLARIKDMLLELFGDDSDDENVVSPLDETPEFIISCKERIAPWVVKLLTPYYIKGRIKGKALFKALAKHLIRLIYQCSRYPDQYEVHSFVSDFLENHKMIRCEADFQQFRIENI